MDAKRFLFAAVSAVFAVSAVAAEPVEVLFAHRDTCDLYMDVYLPERPASDGLCVLYAFGGGFRSGSRKDKHTVDFMNRLAEEGLVAVAMDYRLGFKGHVENLKPADLVRRFSGAVDVAVEDMLSALRYVYDNGAEWGVNKDMIVLAGSSAGAITALQCDFVLSNGRESAALMPENYRPAGIISCAGAVCIFDGKLKYDKAPAPTMFFHGTKDELVYYDKFVFFGKGMYGSGHLSKLFDKKGYPYYIMRFENFGHEISSIPQIENVPDMMRFINLFVRERKDMTIDVTVEEKDVKSPLLDMDLKSYRNPDYKVNAERYIERVGN